MTILNPPNPPFTKGEAFCLILGLLIAKGGVFFLILHPLIESEAYSPSFEKGGLGRILQKD
jgi:hypothetical protein